MRRVSNAFNLPSGIQHKMILAMTETKSMTAKPMPVFARITAAIIFGVYHV